MKKEFNFNLYERAMLVIVLITTAIILLTSCSTSRNATYRDPVKMPSTYVQKNRECGWAY